MAKGVSSLIYGASFIPMFTGSNTMLQSASFSAGRLANNYLNKEAAAGQKAPITDTELIQLAGTIEDLQEKIISSYYEYKGALNKLKDTRSRIILYNKNYSEALKNNSITELVVSSALYEDMQLQEYKQEQEAKKYYLSLERLAGKKAVDSLILSLTYAVRASDSPIKSLSIATATMRAEMIPRSERTRSPIASIPRTITRESQMNIETELFIDLKYLERMRATTSIPPVEPPPIKVIAQPAPIIAPPKTVAIIIGSSLYDE